MRTKKQQEKRTIEERLISEQRVLPKARGGGSLKYEVYGYKNAQGAGQTYAKTRSYRFNVAVIPCYHTGYKLFSVYLPSKFLPICSLNAAFVISPTIRAWLNSKPCSKKRIAASVG